MSTEPVRAGADWLALREPADAAARSPELVDLLRAGLQGRAGAIHDLGCGTGSMARWLATRLAGPQRWVLHDRDAELLEHAAADAPTQAADGAPVQVRTSLGDVTTLSHQELRGAALFTASALLDMLTGEELQRLVATCAGPGCPVLITLSVDGRVELSPPDPFDARVRDAFNAHQRRRTASGSLLGPDAHGAAVEGFRSLGLHVVTRPSPWRLGRTDSALARAWFEGWLGAACEQAPELARDGVAYAAMRLAQAAAGELSVVVHHQDLLALPR